MVLQKYNLNVILDVVFITNRSFLKTIYIDRSKAVPTSKIIKAVHIYLTHYYRHIILSSQSYITTRLDFDLI